MNEAENQDRPIEEDALLLDPSDFNDDEESETVEDTTEPTEEEVSKPTETDKEEENYQSLLDSLSAKIKYKDENIKIENIEDLIEKYQKGLDYDTKVSKLNELETSEEMTFIKEKAKENDMTPKEYIKFVKDYETQQEKDNEIKQYNEMVENGISEEIARKVIETNKVAKELAKEKAQLKEAQALKDKEAEKKAKDDEFLKAYPDIDIKSIPKEVFKEAENSSLLTAYTKYQNDQLKKELDLLKQQAKNEKTSPVGTTTEHGGVVIEKQDDFLKGFGID